MMQLHRELMKEREIADVTASQYIRSLYSLNNSNSFNNLAWLKNKESIGNRLAEFADSTQKTLLSVIVSTLSLVKEKQTYKRIYTHYYNEMMEKAKENGERDTSKKSEREEANWISWEVVKAHEDRLAKDVAGFKGKELTLNEWDTILSYVVLSLYTQFEPRRNQDYQLMYVVKTPKQATDESKNYLTLAEPRQFIFHKYKTAKTHGTQTFDVPSGLSKVLDAYLAWHPLARSKKSSEFPLLIHKDGSMLNAVNAMTRVLNRIFGKRVGSTMLRHIYLSAKYDVDEMNETAEKMGHTGNMQREYMRGEGGQEVTVPTM